MISRLSLTAAVFAVLATTTLTYATTLHSATLASPRTAVVREIQLPQVVITAKRLTPAHG